MAQELPYQILAYYLFTEVQEPQKEVDAHQKFFADKDVTARIYISEQGINGQMSASVEDAEKYRHWMKNHPLFAQVTFKITPYKEHVFPRKTVKYRKQLVALDRDVDMALGGEHLSPEEWKNKLDSNEECLVLDVRNDYEWRVGHFAQAHEPPCKTFRDFNLYAEKLKERVDPVSTPVMMYCTGGIRCEIYSALMKEHGFEKVYQLEGGIISYGEKVGSSHWLGKLFVFDDRLTVPLKEGEETEVIGECIHCKKKSENYFNCANMDCNELYLCCKACLEEKKGCCSDSCTQGARLRPLADLDPHKPFRKWYHYLKNKNEVDAKAS